MKEESISARKLIRDHMLAHSLIPKSFLILKPVITSCLSAHRNYQEHSESVKNAKDQEKVLNEKKVLMKEINNTEANWEKLAKMSGSLNNDFTPVFSLISKANILQHWQHSKFALVVSKYRGFCWGMYMFFSICLDKKNAEAIKFLWILKNMSVRIKYIFV